MKPTNHNLHNELLEAGASAQEAAVLSRLAETIRPLKDLSPIPMQPAWSKPSIFKQIHVGVISFGLACLLLGVGVAGLAQNAYPGTALYQVKLTTENLAVSVDPGYRGDIMMRRAQEVKQLVQVNASPGLVNATLAGYESDVSAYHNGPYADFEYCENMLTQAAKSAHGSDRAAIETALNGLHAKLE